MEYQSIAALFFALLGFAQPASAAVQGVFAHFMVGTITDAHAQQDVADAMNANFDAFALNLLSDDMNGYAGAAVESLFGAAESAGFKLFFSFDMANLNNPDTFMPWLTKYASSSAYYTVDGTPFLSTFGGGTQTFGQATSNEGWTSIFSANDVDPYFVPNFDDAANYPDGFFNDFTVVDGAFGWETAWPTVDQGKTNVSDTVDVDMISEAQSAGKVYMMPWSSLQFKDLDGNFWYRIGEMNFGQRLEQILDDQPDYVEVITWNDAGESHYVGNSWPEAIEGTDIPDYTEGIDHKGWLNVIGPAITALKSGASTPADVVPTNDDLATGAFWYRPVLTTTACPNGKPDGADNAQDVVNYAVLVSANSTGSTINISSGGSQIASESLSPGLNTNSVVGLSAGDVRVEIVDSSGNSISSTPGPEPVNGDSADLCNYNYYVQAI